MVNRKAVEFTNDIQNITFGLKLTKVMKSVMRLMRVLLVVWIQTTVNIQSRLVRKNGISSRGTKKSQFRSEEKPKTHLRRRKANKRLGREKKASLGPPRRRKASFTCLRRKKASLRRPRAKNYNKRHFAREKNRNLLAKIVLILLISRTRNLESIYWQFPVHHRLRTYV